MFEFLTAAQWGMRWARTPVVEKLGDPECYVHHTAGAHPAAAVEAFRQLNEYAINVKGYSAVDYDILVHRNPYTGQVTIGEARGPWRSAATLDRNEEGEAVCLLGYFQPGHRLSRQPHADEVEGVARGIKWGIDKGWIAKSAKILGHRDNPVHLNATTCPGDYLYAKLPTIRSRVAQLLAPPPPPSEDPDVISYNEIKNTTTAPSVEAVLAGTADRWLNAALLKAALFDVTGSDEYDQAAAVKLDAAVKRVD
jgi:hypothetical protein